MFTNRSNAKPSPRQRRKDLTRQLILHEARKILLQSGLAGLSIRRLAARVDYSPAAIYRYYEDKAAILQAIREEGWQLAGQIQERRVAGATAPEEKLIAAGLAYQEFATAYPEHYLLMFDSPDLPPAGVAEIQGDPHFAPLVELIKTGVAEGRLRLPRGMDAAGLGFILWTSSHGMAMTRLKFMRRSHADYDRHCERLIRGFILSMVHE